MFMYLVFRISAFFSASAKEYENKCGATQFRPSSVTLQWYCQMQYSDHRYAYREYCLVDMRWEGTDSFLHITQLQRHHEHDDYGVVVCLTFGHNAAPIVSHHRTPGRKSPGGVVGLGPQVIPPWVVIRDRGLDPLVVR
jgi:hypothetical protein